ncbi:TPA: hypothetical protein DEO28_04940 [Candidatus Dependentiae bacterium]|nr:MAG: NADH dehydrogenase subunit 5 [candidate division TM6 bacterium GW2011_GWE2_31_21]KKP53898.1 MAG: NADH dehydrogenase subunit 5 [candidate division TM6 bacterium GW2011_GWF2_33_332]HBS47678.1 hypothetical protein [Candidatus Dependentiae bacterium]HBZ73827.1 hypothetical protein [Candidatus Dependentiae bacterium]
MQKLNQNRLVFKEKLFEYTIWFLFIIFCLVFIALNFRNLENYVFQMYDSLYYPYSTKSFLTSGEYHWAEGKPGIVFLAGLYGLDTPLKLMYLYIWSSIFLAIGLFLISKIIIRDIYMSLIPSLLWVTSELCFYYSRTQLLIFLPFYFIGVWLCYKGIENLEWWKYYLGCFLLGYSVLSYYLVVYYLFFIFGFFIYLFYKKGFSLFSFIFKTMVPFLLPIILLDSVVSILYLWLGKRNIPFSYAFYLQYKTLCTSFEKIDLFKFFYFPAIFWQWDFCVSILIFISFLFFLYYLFRAFKSKQIINSDLLFLSLLITLFFIDFRHVLGQFTALRAYIPVIPIMYILIPFFISKLIAAKHSKWVFLAFLIFGFWRLSANYNDYSNRYNTGYNDLTYQLRKNNFDVISYYGIQLNLEYLLEEKEIIPLGGFCNLNSILKNDQKRKEIVDLLKTRLNAGKKVALLFFYVDQNFMNFAKSQLSQLFSLKEIAKVNMSAFAAAPVVNEYLFGYEIIFDEPLTLLPYGLIYSLELKNEKL